MRQTYTDRSGRVTLVVIETLPGSAWDAAPPVAQARRVTRGGQHLLEWSRVGAGSAVVRRVSDGTAVLVSSHVLPLPVLERGAVALR